jgi:hypothetical protein
MGVFVIHISPDRSPGHDAFMVVVEGAVLQHIQKTPHAPLLGEEGVEPVDVQKAEEGAEERSQQKGVEDRRFTYCPSSEDRRFESSRRDERRLLLSKKSLMSVQ